MTPPILEAVGLHKVYGNRRKPGTYTHAVEDVSFALATGETLALVGESGCGKSTTARMVMRLIEASEGNLLFDGAPVTGDRGKVLQRLRADVQMVFQDPFASLNPRMTVRRIIAEPLVVQGVRGDHDRRVVELMDMVGLRPDHAARFPHEFSGGQRQRIGIARALALNPRVLVCDEPVSALDVSIQAQVINLLQDLKASLGLSLLFISHDLSVVQHIADRVAVMHLGRLIEIADKRSLFDRPAHPYTRALLSAVPRPDPARQTRDRQSDPVPAPLPPGRAGCLYRNRCPLATDRCTVEAPARRAISHGHQAACHHSETLSDWTAQPPLAARSAGMTKRFDLYARLRAARQPDFQNQTEI